MEHLLAADLAAAADLAGTVARQTPVIGARWLSEMAGREVQLKCENLQRSGSFKLRGAYVRMSRLTPQERERGVVAASAGNHAQGVALAARELGISATVFMPTGAALPKVAATKEYGAEVVLSGDIVDDALSAAQEYAARTGAVFIHPFDHRDIVLGQASVGLEILRQVPDVRTILVPTGGGGLVAGIAAAVRAQRSEAVVVGVQAERAAAYPPSMSAGHPIRLAAMSTMADGIAVARPGAVPFAILTDLHVDVRTVTENSIARALVLLMERSKQVVEPAGVPGVSTLLEQPDGLEPPVVAVLSGGNVDPVLLQRVLRYGLAAAGRYMTVAVQVADNPGSLAALLGVLAQCNVNVLGVDHVFTDPGLAVGQVDVVVQLETRGFEHRRETLAALRQAGYELRAADA